MSRYRNTVVGSYPRPTQVADTMKNPTLTQTEVDDMIRWAAKDQADLGLDVITDGEQTRLDFNLSFYGFIEGITLESDSPRRFGPPAPVVPGSRDTAIPGHHAPPDPNSAVGPNHIVTTVNSSIALNFMRSANAPQIRAGVMMKNII